MNDATVTKADEQEAAAFLWALDRDSFAELCGAFARHREAERARIVAWLRANRPSDAGAAGFAAYIINVIETGEHLT